MIIKRNKLIKELIYKCKYLGIKECSLVLHNFSINEIQNLTNEEIKTFHQLLDFDDITLWDFIISSDKKILKDNKMKKLIKKIQNFNKSI